MIRPSDERIAEATAEAGEAMLRGKWDETATVSKNCLATLVGCASIVAAKTMPSGEVVTAGEPKLDGENRD